MTQSIRPQAPKGMPPAFTMQHASKYLKRGFDALMKRDFKDADACAHLVLKYMPELAQAHFLVGLIALETREWANARKAFSIVVRLDEKHAAAWAQFARMQVRMGFFNEAENALEKAVEHGSEDPLVLDVIGNVYTLMGNQEKALEYFTKASAGTNNLSFLMNKAKAQMFLGKFKETRETLESVLAIETRIPTAHFTLARLEKAKNTDHIDEMNALVSKYKKHSPPTTSLYYGLGKEYEDLEMWPEAFDAYAQGGLVRRKGLQYDEAEEIEMFDRLKETFTKKWLESVGSGCDTKAPIFIIGQPRTGTTLIERIITARDDVHSAGELPQMGMSLKRMCEAPQAQLIHSSAIETASKLDMKALGEMYMDTTRSLRSDLPHFVDKLPVNYIYAPLIAASLPNAKIIHVRRDAMDSCFASFKQLFAEAYYHSYDQEEMARHHVRYRNLMEHYSDVLGDRMIEVHYEDVVADMETQARRMMDYLDLDWQDASLEFHKSKTAVTTASAAQVREKAHSRSVGKWRRFEQELAPMQEIIKEAGYLTS